MSAIRYLTLAAIFGIACGYPSGHLTGHKPGVIESVCDSMNPGHLVDPQTSEFPYIVNIDNKEVVAGGKVHITISGGVFKGFFVQVRDGDIAVGQFNIAETDEHSTPINCFGKLGNAATQKSIRTEKNSVTLEWIAPSERKTYTIYATIVKVRDEFWTRVNVGSITVD